MKDKMGGSVEPQGMKSFTAEQSFEKNFETHGEREEQEGLYHAQKAGSPGSVAKRFKGWTQ